jgi:hypothetical protein
VPSSSQPARRELVAPCGKPPTRPLTSQEEGAGEQGEQLVVVGAVGGGLGLRVLRLLVNVREKLLQEGGHRGDAASHANVVTEQQP